jgi:hypothetical protein
VLKSFKSSLIFYVSHLIQHSITYQRNYYNGEYIKIRGDAKMGRISSQLGLISACSKVRKDNIALPVEPTTRQEYPSTPQSDPKIWETLVCRR